MKGRGFSVVELAVVIAIIGVISLMVFAGMRSTQVAARDDERHAKAQILARSLETLYRSGNPQQSYSPGGYPSMTRMKQLADSAAIHTLLPNIENSSTKLSWSSSPHNFRVLRNNSGLNNDQTERGTYETADVGQDEFVYAAYNIFERNVTVYDADNWAYCNSVNISSTCRRFNLYYRTEADNALHVIRSTHQ